MATVILAIAVIAVIGGTAFGVWQGSVSAGVFMSILIFAVYNRG